MKLPKLPEQFAKTLAGFGIVLVGAAIHLVPIIGPIASPVIMTAGGSMIIWGGKDKYDRYKKGEDPIAHERNLKRVLVQKLTKPKKE